MATITINSKSVSGRNIVVVNGRVIVDGKDETPESKEINIVVTGDVEKLEVDACSKIEVNGNVHNVKTLSGDVEISGVVSGNVQTMSGDVKCGDIGGSVSTMSGDVKRR
jgi:hypothetical protein